MTTLTANTAVRKSGDMKNKPTPEDKGEMLTARQIAERLTEKFGEEVTLRRVRGWLQRKKIFGEHQQLATSDIGSKYYKVPACVIEAMTELPKPGPSPGFKLKKKRKSPKRA